jgi:hypothetical protein
VFTGRRIETVVLLLPVSVAVIMFTDIPLLLQKRPIRHNMIVHAIGSLIIVSLFIVMSSPVVSMN